MKKVIVTGGAGFIGSHLVDQLLETGHFVTVIDNLSGGRITNLENHFENKNFNFLEWDICNLRAEMPVFQNVDCLYHLAGIGDIVPSIEKPSEYLDVNVQGTVRTIEAARLNKIRRFVYAASSSCYGLAKTPTDETHSIDPQYPYALSKYLGEQVVFHWGATYKIEVNSICIFNAYGPRVKTNGAYGAVFGVFLKQRLANAPLTIVGDGNQSRDFVHVKDIALAFVLAGNSVEYHQRFNIGAGNPKSILELADIIGGEKIFIPKRPGEPEITFANIEKAKNILGWIPSIPFKKGVQEMLDNLEYWNDAPLWDKESIAQTTKNWFDFLGSN